MVREYYSHFKHSFFIALNLAISAIFLAIFINTPYSSADAPRSEVLGNASVIDPKYNDKLLEETADSINTQREANGLPKLNQSAELDALALKRANDMAKNSYYAHKGSDGKFFSDYMKEQGIGYTFACENLNTTQFPSSEKYINSWLDSKPHRDCMLKNSHQYAGYAVAVIPSVNGVALNQQVIVAIYSN